MLLPNVIDFSNKFFFRFSINYFCFVQLLFVMFVPISSIKIIELINALLVKETYID